MLVLADRNFFATGFITALTETGADFLIRAKTGSTALRLPVLERLHDGTGITLIAGRRVRVVEAAITVTIKDPDTNHVHREEHHYRLVTTLLDPAVASAFDLVRLYHERWEIEIAYLALRHTILDGHVLRSGDRPGLEQEIWALLTLYQLLRMVMVTAVESRPGTDPDRASFTTALQAARDQVTAAAGIDPDDPCDLLGVIGRAVLATLLPARRPRYSARKIKNGTTRYIGRDDARPQTPTRIVAIEIAVRSPPLTSPRRRPVPRPARPTRRQQITAIMNADPTRAWSGRELAKRLGIAPRNMLTQLAEWTRHGFLTRTGTGNYALPDPPNSHA
jgi:hypothetical protein